MGGRTCFMVNSSGGDGGLRSTPCGLWLQLRIGSPRPIASRKKLHSEPRPRLRKRETLDKTIRPVAWADLPGASQICNKIATPEVGDERIANRGHPHEARAPAANATECGRSRCNHPPPTDSERPTDYPNTAPPGKSNAALIGGRR